MPPTSPRLKVDTLCWYKILNQRNKEITLILRISYPTIKHKAGHLNLAEEFGNVSKAYTCKVLGASRNTFYCYQELAETGGVLQLWSIKAEEHPT